MTLKGTATDVRQFFSHFLAARLLAMVVKRTMVIELTGIRIAAITGDNFPETAKDNPRIL